MSRPPRLRVIVARAHECPADAAVRVVGARLAGGRPDEVLRAAGPDLHRTLRDLRRRGISASEDRAVVTTAGRLDSRWLIHVRVPTFRPEVDRDHLLSRATRTVLATADEVGARRLVMPLLGTTGPYWPLDDAIRIGCGTLTATPTSVTEITLAVATPAALERVAEALARQQRP